MSAINKIVDWVGKNIWGFDQPQVCWTEEETIHVPERCTRGRLIDGDFCVPAHDELRKEWICQEVDWPKLHCKSWANQFKLFK